jgi:hypothetical protein
MSISHEELENRILLLEEVVRKFMAISLHSFNSASSQVVDELGHNWDIELDKLQNEREIK